MKTKKVKKMVFEAGLVAEVEIEYIFTQDEWSPYLSLRDAARLDEVRKALSHGDLKRASSYGQVYQLTPIPA